MMVDVSGDCENPFTLFGMEEWLSDSPTEEPGQTAEVTLEDDELKGFIEQSRASNTVKKTKSDPLLPGIGGARAYRRPEKSKTFQLELKWLLSHFFVNVRKQNSETTNQRRSHRFNTVWIVTCVTYCGQFRSVIKDREFSGSREALKAKRKHLRKGRKGAKKNAAEPLSAADKKLWESGQLGDRSPQVLQSTVWFYAMMHFGWRGGDEHRRACYGDFRGGVSDDGREYFEFSVEHGSKFILALMLVRHNEHSIGACLPQVRFNVQSRNSHKIGL